MRTTVRDRFRAPAITLRTAALALAAACSLAEDTEDERQPAVAEVLSTPPSACDGVSLDARRDNRRPRWTDGHVVFAGSALTFVIPDEIPVTLGAAGNGKVKLTYSSGSGPATTCIYRGNGRWGHGGDAYVFRKCRVGFDTSDDDDESDGPADPLPTAGSIASANTFTLHVSRGDPRFPATAVHLALPGPALDDGDECTTDSCSAAQGPAHTPVDTAFCRGKANFHDRTLAGLGGNGRACSDCHMDSQRFQLSPAAARARFDEMVSSGVDDPLFRAIDADDFRINGAAAHEYTNLLRGLVRIEIPLPSNIKLVDPASCFTAGVPAPCQTATTYAVSTESVADVWRSVPTVLNVNVTGPDGLLPTSGRGPNQMGGYQLDARIDTLQDQAFGALVAHAAITNPASVTGGFLDDVAAYQQALVSPPEGPLTALEQQGKEIFNRACATCHGGAGLSTPFTPPPGLGFPDQPRYHNIQTAFPRPVGATFVFPAATAPVGAMRTFEITQLDGFKQRKTTTDMGRALLTGVVTQGPVGCAHPPCGGPLENDFQRLDIPTLRNISNTAPYFSNNSAATLDEVLDHYEAFFASAKASNPSDPMLSTTVPPTFDRPVKSVVGVAGPGFFGAANGADGGVERAALLAYLRRL